MPESTTRACTTTLRRSWVIVENSSYILLQYMLKPHGISGCEIYLCPSSGSMPRRRPTMCCKPPGVRSRLGSHGVSFCEFAREHLLCQAYVRLPLLATPSPLGSHAIDGCRVTFLPESRCLNKALAHCVRARSAVLVHPVFLLEEDRPLRRLDSDRPWRGQGHVASCFM